MQKREVEVSSRSSYIHSDCTLYVDADMFYVISNHSNNDLGHRGSSYGQGCHRDIILPIPENSFLSLTEGFLFLPLLRILSSNTFHDNVYAYEYLLYYTHAGLCESKLVHRLMQIVVGT